MTAARKVGAIAAVIFAAAAMSMAAQSDALDTYVRAELERSHTPGTSVAVVKDGKVILARGYGIANLELGAAATGDSVYEVLSVGKQFTAACVLLLARDGKLSLDKAASSYLPTLPASWRDITVRQLLAHTSGLAEYTSAPGWRQSVRLDRTPDDLIAPVMTMPLLFVPGTDWKYSNTDYYVLGKIIEQISGTSYGEFLQQRIFQPLGMTETRLNDLHAIVPGRATGYHWDNTRLSIADAISPTQMWAAGGIVSSATDLAKWLVALDTGSLASRQMLEEMWRPAVVASGKNAPYGMGTELDSDHGHRSVGHQGGGLAFNATILLYPDDHVGVAVIGNLTQTPSLVMAHHIAGLYLPAISDTGNTGVADVLPDLTQRFRDTLRDAAAGKVNANRIAPEARDKLVPFLQTSGPRFLGSLGTLDTVTLLEDAIADGTRTRRYRTAFSSGQRLVWTVTFAPDGTIRSLDPRPE